jgi:drug/metabolite transporter (DMT)-like permease
MSLSSTQNNPPNDALKGIALMVFAMAGFAICDALIKVITASLPVGYMLLAMSVLGTPVFAYLAWRAGHRAWGREALHPALMARNLSEGLAAACVITSLSLADLSLVSAVLQATPLFVTLAGAVLLGERVGLRRWSAVILGLFGVILIIGPGSGELSVGLILALIGTVGLAGRDVATRYVPKSIPTMAVATYGFGMGIPVGLFLIALNPALPQPDWYNSSLLLAAVIILLFAYYAITAAMRVGDVSLVAPFRYTRIVFALLIGFLFFAERPTPSALLGVAIVVGSGLFVLYRARKVA